MYIKKKFTFAEEITHNTTPQYLITPHGLRRNIIYLIMLVVSKGQLAEEAEAYVKKRVWMNEGGRMKKRRISESEEREGPPDGWRQDSSFPPPSTPLSPWSPPFPRLWETAATAAIERNQCCLSWGGGGQVVVTLWGTMELWVIICV